MRIVKGPGEGVEIEGELTAQYDDRYVNDALTAIIQEEINDIHASLGDRRKGRCDGMKTK